MMTYCLKVLSLLVVGLCLSAAVLAAEAPSVTPVDTSEGKAILENRCSVCHAAPRPKDYSLREWPGIINKMGAKANLRKSEEDALMKYLQATLRPTRGLP